MKSKCILTFVFLFLSNEAILFAQGENISKWSFSANLTPHFTNDYYFGIYGPEKGLGIQYFGSPSQTNVQPIPAVDLKIDYALIKKLSVEAGIGYVVYNTRILKYNIYLQDAEGSTLLLNETDNAHIHILELPSSVNYYIIDDEYLKAYVSLGDVSSFVVAETNAGDFGIAPNKVHTTVYQNYLQFALGIDVKTKHVWDWYVSPMYRISMVNYYDQVHFDIYAFPNVFYERMLGLEIGMKFNKLKKK